MGLFGVTGRARLGVLCCAAAVAVAAQFGAAGVARAQECPNEALREEQGMTALPDCRAYELVSPVDKGGADVVTDPTRVRVSREQGSVLPLAVTFSSLGGFAGAEGSGIAFDYLAQRTLAPATQGWATHAITPVQQPMSLSAVAGARDSLYEGEGDPELSKMVFRAFSPLTEAPNVAKVQSNLYLRDDLRSAGAGSYQLLSDAVAPVVPSSSNEGTQITRVAGTSSDLSHVVFESLYPLTADAPTTNEPKLYESVDGELRLVGILPGGEAAPRSIAGQDVGLVHPIPAYAPHVVSRDGSRVFFTVPPDNASTSGDVYMRDDQGTLAVADDMTVKLNESERTDCNLERKEAEPSYVCTGAAEPDPNGARPARYWDAAVDGSRVFFTTIQALTDDAPVGGNDKLYMYDASKPASDPHNLTFLSADNNPTEPPGEVLGVLGASEDGRTVYYAQKGQTVSGQPTLEGGIGIYVWREGDGVRYVGQMQDTQQDPLDDIFPHVSSKERGSVVSPDGRFLLVSLRYAPWPGGFDQGDCGAPGLPIEGKVGCRELYLYDARTGGHPVCVSCAGPVPSAPALFMQVSGKGGAASALRLNTPMSEDGSEVFFSTPEPLVPADVNGKQDVYEWSRSDGEAHLISSGQSTDDSYFLNASPDGHDVFFTTREQLNAWDGDQSIDVYDARIDGGVPAPPPTMPVCSGETCQGLLGGVPSSISFASNTIAGAGGLKTASEQVVKRSSNAQKLSRALRACGKKRNRAQRRRCESKARKRYAKKASKSGGSK